MARPFLLLAAILTAAPLAAAAGPNPGPDVIVGDLPDSRSYGPGTTNTNTYAFDLGTTSCNKGNNNLRWVPTAPYHPVICQNIYRALPKTSGAGSWMSFEQIGMSWVKHGFYATSQNLCSTCNYQAINGNVLGVGCSDPYDQGLNGTQTSLGPRSEINPATGVFPWSSTHTWPPITDALSRRIQVSLSDLSFPDNAGATYFGEAMYVTPDDAAAGNSWNNISWRRFTVNTSRQWYDMFAADTVHQSQPALFAWQSLDPTVRLAGFDVPGEGPNGNGGRYWLAHAVTQTGPSTWHYEYCLLNMTSDRAAAAFTIPIAPGTTITNAATRTPASHSGEPYSNAPWTITTTATAVTFSCPETYAQNANASALRWGLTSTFRFDASAAPGSSDGTIAVALFKPGAAGTPNAFTLSARTPGGASAVAAAPANDDCNAPQPLHSGENRSSTLGATTSLPAPGGACAAITNDVWFTYMYHSYAAPANCLGSIAFDTCGSEFDTAIAVYPSTTCPISPGSEIACNDNAASGSCASGASGSSSVSVPASEGATYLIRVGSPAGQRGNLVLTVTPPFCIPPVGACCANNGSCQAVTGQSSCYSGTFFSSSSTCSPNPCPQPPPPSNDNCAGAIIIGDSNLGYPALEGTNASANQSSTEVCSFNQGLYDVWYLYTPATTGTVIADTCTVPSSGVTMDTMLSIHESTCTGTIVACNDDDPSGLCAATSRITTTLNAGTPYYIRVCGYGAIRGDFVLRVAGGGGVAPTSSGACCWGTACIVTTAANCAAANQSFAGQNTACNTGANAITPCCNADFDHSGGLSVQDIFDFLNTWFAGSPSAAFGGDGVRAPIVQDIFDFLNAWFNGC
jgi:hypothetical protein